MIVKLAVVIWCMLFSLPQCLWAEQTRIDLSAHTPANAALRSLVLPGWGQCFNQQKTKGYLLVSGAVIAAAATVYFDTTAKKTYEDYEKRGMVNDSLYTDYEGQVALSHSSAILAAGVWIYAVTDAWFTARNTYIYGKKNDTSLVLLPHEDGARLVYRTSF